MKTLLELLFTMILATEAFAAEIFECENKEKTMQIAAISGDGEPDTLTVQYKGKVVFREVPAVRIDQAGRTEFHSLKFRTPKGAPSSLYLQIYRQGANKLMGEFSEVSYQPQLPVASVECKGRLGK
ncbi:MAG: hypothetical protein K2X47_07325 [Bdellovibrionales bacterium]|nr:hypothetical protein [Bdellovibrionales bacterium]